LFFNEDGATFTPLGFFVEAKHGGDTFVIINKTWSTFFLLNRLISSRFLASFENLFETVVAYV